MKRKHTARRNTPAFSPATAAATRVASVIVLLITASQSASAQEPVQDLTFASLPTASPPIAYGGGAQPTPAWNHFCTRYPEECAVDAAEPPFVELTPELWKTLNAVNRQVNADIKPVTDQDHWGVADRWDFPDDGCGDCEDYQLLKRKLLIKAGLPRRAMRMTVVIDEEGQGHAVMMVRTSQGDLILDNKRPDVLAWQQTGYVYIKQEGSEPNMDWVSLGGASSPVVTAGP